MGVSGLRIADVDNIPDGVPYIRNNGFEYSGLNTIDLPKSLTTMESKLFNECYFLRTMTTICSEAFKDCCLGEIIIPESVTFLEESAFADCWPASTITMPSSLKTMEQNVFQYMRFCDSDGSRLSVTAANLSGHHFFGEDRKLSAQD